MKRYVIKRLSDGKYYCGYHVWLVDINKSVLFGGMDDTKAGKGEVAVEVEIKEVKG